MNQDMKKIYSFMVAALALAAVSCNKEVSPVETPVGETVVFSAEMDATKTILNGNKSEWVAGDKITIHNGTKGYEFSTTEAGAKVDFTYTGDDFAGTKFMAAYPAATEADVEAKTVKANIPTYQSSVDNSYNPAAAVAVAYTENASLAFKNATSLIKFTVKGNNAKGLIFYGNNGEAVSGDVVVTLDAENAVKSVVGQETTITENEVTETKLITWAKLWADTDNWCFKEGTTYYLAVAPQNFEKGFSFELEIDGVGNKVVKTVDTEKELKPNTIYNIGELEYVAPAVPEQNWGIAGTMTGWADKADIAMVLEGDWYIAKNVTITTADEFKFRTNGTWGTERTAAKVISEGTEVAVSAAYDNTKVDASAIYDVYLSKGADKMKLVKVGDIEVEEPSDEPVASEWGIVGDLTGWADKADIVMFSYKGMYVAYDVKFTAAGSFKIRKNGVWNDAANFGLQTSGEVEAGYYYDVVTSGGSGNIKVAAGTYDIWFDLAGKKVYVLTPGTDPATVSKGTPSAPSNWNLVGSFNNWNPGDSKYSMAQQGNYYVYKNFTCSAQVEMKFAPGSWGGDKGGTSSSVITKDKKYSTGSTNIKVPAGTYDVYLSTDLKNYWFMTPGSTPAN